MFSVGVNIMRQDNGVYPVTAELSIWSLFAQASIVVKSVMLLLFSASIISWAIIIQKGNALKKAKKQLKEFETKFWGGIDLNTLQNALNVRKNKLQGIERIFYTSFQEYLRLRAKPNITISAVMDGVNRMNQVALSKEEDNLEKHVPFLATVGSISPYVGLFGTVWGIMHSFIALGSVQQATIAMVAPGIAEALIATAIGLFAAIPAVVAFNRYSHAIEKIVNSYHYFSEEFSSILYRQAYEHHDATLKTQQVESNAKPRQTVIS